MRQIWLFGLFVDELQIHVSSGTVDDGGLGDATLLNVLVGAVARVLRPLRALRLEALHFLVAVLMSMVVRQIGDVSPELSMALMRAVEVPRLYVFLLSLLLALGCVVCVGLVACSLGVHAVGHVNPGIAQKACGFVQSRLV